MIPMLKYTLARLGLLAAVFLILVPIPVPGMSLLVKALLALLITMPLSWFMLRRLRDNASVALAEGAKRRRARRAELRSALAGDDDGPTNT